MIDNLWFKTIPINPNVFTRNGVNYIFNPKNEKHPNVQGTSFERS